MLNDEYQCACALNPAFIIHHSSFIIHHYLFKWRTPMNRGRLFSLTIVAVLALLAVSSPGAARAAADKKDKNKAAVPASKLNEQYTAKIKEYTTEKYFLTELVDHLPASDKVPSPDRVLGYVV